MNPMGKRLEEFVPHCGLGSTSPSDSWWEGDTGAARKLLPPKPGLPRVGAAWHREG